MLKVRLVGEVPLVETEMLSDAESAALAKDLSGNGLLEYLPRKMIDAFWSLAAPSHPS